MDAALDSVPDSRLRAAEKCSSLVRRHKAAGMLPENEFVIIDNTLSFVIAATEAGSVPERLFKCFRVMLRHGAQACAHHEEKLEAASRVQ